MLTACRRAASRAVTTKDSSTSARPSVVDRVEVAVERGRHDADLLGHLTQRQRHQAGVLEQVERRVEDRPAGALLALAARLGAPGHALDHVRHATGERMCTDVLQGRSTPAMIREVGARDSDRRHHSDRPTDPGCPAPRRVTPRRLRAGLTLPDSPRRTRRHVPMSDHIGNAEIRKDAVQSTGRATTSTVGQVAEHAWSPPSVTWPRPSAASGPTSSRSGTRRARPATQHDPGACTGHATAPRGGAW